MSRPIVYTGHDSFDYQQDAVFIGVRKKQHFENSQVQDGFRLTPKHTDYSYTLASMREHLKAYAITFKDFNQLWGEIVIKETFNFLYEEGISVAYLYFFHHRREDRKVVFHGALLTRTEPKLSILRTWNNQPDNQKTLGILTEMGRFVSGKTFRISQELAEAKHLHPKKRHSFQEVFGMPKTHYFAKKKRLLQAVA